MWVAYGAGLRVSEVVSLKVGDIGGERMTLRLDQGKATQCRFAALGDGRHQLELREAPVAALGVTSGMSMGTDDVGDLQGGSRLHDCVRLQCWWLDAAKERRNEHSSF